MATFKISELMLLLCDMAQDGYDYTDVLYSEPEDDMPACLDFFAMDTQSGFTDYGSVDAEDLPDDYDVETSFHPVPQDLNEPCSFVLSYQQLLMFGSVCQDSISYIKEQLSRKDISADERSYLSKKLKSVDQISSEINQYLSDSGFTFQKKSSIT